MDVVANFMLSSLLQPSYSKPSITKFFSLIHNDPHWTKIDRKYIVVTTYDSPKNHTFSS